MQTEHFTPAEARRRIVDLLSEAQRIVSSMEDVREGANGAQLIPLTRPDLARAAGIPVDSEWQLRWLRRNPDYAGAFVRLGRKRIYIDPAKFHERARAHSAAG